MKDGGALTPLVYAVRANDLESVKVLLAAGADVNQVTGYGWSPLLVATQNRYYKLGAYLLDHGADVNLANKGAWTPLYLATDNRNIESGDYPVRKGDMDHLDFIKLLLDKGANVNARMKDSTETRTVFTNQWLDENGATAFLRASQSGDIVLMKLLLAHGADPKIDTVLHVTALQVAAGIGWVEGITYEWSPEQTVEAVKMLLDLGLDPNAQADTGRVALHGAAHKGATAVVQLLVDHGAKLEYPGLREHRQPRRQAGRPHVGTGGLRRWSGPRRRAIGDRASRDRAAAAQIDDGCRASRAARRPHAGIHLYHRSVRLKERRKMKRILTAALGLVVCGAFSSRAAEPENGELDVVQVRPNFYMIAGAGGNIGVQIGSTASWW